MQSPSRDIQQNWEFFGSTHSSDSTQRLRPVQSSSCRFSCRNAPTQHLLVSHGLPGLIAHGRSRALGSNLISLRINSRYSTPPKRAPSAQASKSAPQRLSRRGWARIRAAHDGASKRVSLAAAARKSTATTLVYARHSKGKEGLSCGGRDSARQSGGAGRALHRQRGSLPGHIAVTAAGAGRWPGLGLAAASYGWRQLGRQSEVPIPEVSNPTELRTAVGFGVLYAVVLFFRLVVKHCRQRRPVPVRAGLRAARC